MGDPKEAPGFLACLRASLDAGLELLQVRLALLGNELEEQKLRLAEGLALTLFGAMLLAIATLLACAFVLVLFWDSYRLPALGVMTVLLGGGGLWLLAAGRERVRSSGSMFQSSLDELAQDREALRPAPSEPPEGR